MKRSVPRLTSDEEAEAFLDTDLSDLDFSQFKSGRLRFAEDSSADAAERPRSSETYRLFEKAMVEEKQIVCMYAGERREVCPIILGHKKGEERALTYQFAGASTSTPLPPDGAWRCLDLAKVSEVLLQAGSWLSGPSHKQPSHCLDDVDLDVNPQSPYSPKRNLEHLRTAKAAHPVPSPDSFDTKPGKTHSPNKPRG